MTANAEGLGMFKQTSWDSVPSNHVSGEKCLDPPAERDETRQDPMNHTSIDEGTCSHSLIGADFKCTQAKRWEHLGRTKRGKPER